MVLPHCLRIVNTSVYIGRVVLCEADDGLQEDCDVEDEAKDGVRRLEVLVARAGFVKFNDDKTDN